MPKCLVLHVVKHTFLLLLLLQILGRCIASANSPIDTVRKGVQHWLDLGVPARKLVLGLPWYGEYTQHRYGRLKLEYVQAVTPASCGPA